MRTLGSLITVREHSFFTGNLSSEAVVVDAGANVGDFSREIVCRFGARTFALEPVPSVREKIAPMEGLQTCEVALAPKSGPGQMHLSTNPEANSLRALRRDCEIITIDVRCLNLRDFMQEQRLTQIDLLKLDIEGTEIELLLHEDERVLRQIGQVATEFHADTHELDRDRQTEIARIREVISRLGQLGFTRINRTRPFWFNVLFVNRKAFALSRLRGALLTARYEYLPRFIGGIKRRGAMLWSPKGAGQ